MSEGPTPEDMKRDLAADHAEWDDMHRDVHIALCWGLPKWYENDVYVGAVYEFARLADDALPAANARARAAEALLRRLVEAADRLSASDAMCADVDFDEEVSDLIGEARKLLGGAE